MVMSRATTHGDRSNRDRGGGFPPASAPLALKGTVRLLNIFLAEDNPGDVFLVRRALNQSHIPHELHVATDGQQALDYVEEMGKPGVPCPDLLLLDVNLPKADGVRVLSEFRHHSQCTETPVIMVSSSDAPKDWERVAALGVDRYFCKPSELGAYMRLGGVVLDVMGQKAA
jgi:CheY-like chemotaxis protein